MVCDKTKELTIPILLSAFYSTHINLLTSTTSHFTLPRLFISHDLLFLLHIFSDFLSNMRLCPFLQPRHVFRFYLSLPFSQIRHSLRFTASMSVSLFTASQICYHLCEAKMKRSQIGVRRRISEFLCVKSTSFFFFFSSIRYLIFDRNPVFIPVWPKRFQYGRY